MPAEPTQPPAGDSEALHRIVDPYFWNPDTADALTGALIAAGFTRANHGETVAPYTGDFDPCEAVRDSGLAAERDAAIRERDEARKKLAGVGVEEFYAVSHRLSEVAIERDALAERLEAALTGYECKGCRGSFRRENAAYARAETAEKRVSALAEALNQIPADALRQVVEYARAALASNQETKP